MHTNTETLGDIIKYYRERSDYTVEELANKVGVSERYLYRIENEGKKPSYDVLFRIIRTLSISSERIFYPEITNQSQNISRITHLLYLCDEKTIKGIESLIKEIL